MPVLRGDRRVTSLEAQSAYGISLRPIHGTRLPDTLPCSRRPTRPDGASPSGVCRRGGVRGRWRYGSPGWPRTPSPMIRFFVEDQAFDMRVAHPGGCRVRRRRDDLDRRARVGPPAAAHPGTRPLCPCRSASWRCRRSSGWRSASSPLSRAGRSGRRHRLARSYGCPSAFSPMPVPGARRRLAA